MAAAMLLNLLLAALAGVAIPLTLKAVGRDPAIGSSIILTIITDAGGFFLFLGLGGCCDPSDARAERTLRDCGGFAWVGLQSDPGAWSSSSAHGSGRSPTHIRDAGVFGDVTQP